MTVVMTAPISTTSMTGFASRWRGFSFLTASTDAWRTISRLKIETPAFRCLAMTERCSCVMSLSPRTAPRLQRKCSTMGPSASAGKNVSPPTMTTTPTRSPTNSGPWVGRVPAVAGTFFFCTSAPASARIATIGRKRASKHRDPQRRVVEGCVGRQPGERRAVVAGRRTNGVQDLREAVRAGVQRPGLPAGRTTATAVTSSIAADVTTKYDAPPSSSRTGRSSSPGTPASGRSSGPR